MVCRVWLAPRSPPPTTPQPAAGPPQGRRRASSSGVMVVGQIVALGRGNGGKTVTINVTDSVLVIACDDGIRTIRRTTDPTSSQIKANRPRVHMTCPLVLPALLRPPLRLGADSE